MVSGNTRASVAAVLAPLPPRSLAVWLDDPAFGPSTRIGVLTRSRLDSVRFSYESAWLGNPVAFQFDPGLELAAGEVFPKDSG